MSLVPAEWGDSKKAGDPLGGFPFLCHPHGCDLSALPLGRVGQVRPALSEPAVDTRSSPGRKLGPEREGPAQDPCRVGHGPAVLTELSGKDRV